MTDTSDGPPKGWLVAQLKAWPTRVDPELTTSIRYLMEAAAEEIERLTGLAEIVEEAKWREALLVARGQFAFYVEQHLSKQPPDKEKAATNQRRVDRIDGVLKGEWK